MADELASLKHLYSFNPSTLQNQFLSKSDSLHRSNMWLLKHHDLLLFRERCHGIFDLSAPLFSFNASVITRPLQSMGVKMLFSHPARVHPDLTTVLLGIYPNTPWICQYFVTSTFPAVFAGFVTEELSEHALQFILNNIEDQLAPQLIGAFLLHCFIFRDRLLQQFYANIAERSELFNDSIIERCFLDAFRACANYFSSHQIRALSTLVAADSSAARSAVFDHFLLEVVCMWRFSPLFATTEFVFRHEGSTEVFPLLGLIETYREHPEFVDEVMSFFDEQCHGELPCAGSLFFTGGVYLPLTVVDLELITGLTSPGVTVDLSTALQDAFAIHVRTSYFPPGIRVPDLNESTTADPLEQFRRRRILHDFLSEHAGGLKQFDLMIAATRKVLALRIEAYASLLLRLCPTLQPENFAIEQMVHYCSGVVMSWIQMPKLQDFIKRSIPMDVPFPEYIKRSVGSRLPDQLGSADHSQTILRVAAEFVSEWKTQFAKRVSKTSASETDEQNCEFFIQVIDELSFALLMGRLSRIRFGLPPLDSEARAQMLEYFLKAASEPPVGQLAAADDQPVSGVLQRSRSVQLFMLSAEEVMRQRFESGDEASGIGDLLLYFLELEKWLRPIMDNERCEGDNAAQIRLIVALCQREPVYLKWNFLRVRVVMRNFTANEIKEMPMGPVIGGLFSPEIRAVCRRLKKWLGFRAKIKYYPPLEGIVLIGPH
jgi:hypothetical protein